MKSGLTENLESLFVDGLPYLSCVSNDFVADGIERKGKKNAVKYRNIQHNPNSMIRALTFDVDSDCSLFQWSDNNCLPPNWISVNKENGHAHYGYFINAPVSRTFKSRIKPQRFLNAVAKGLTVKIGSDMSYSGFMTKNPLSEYWQTWTVEDKPYDLEEIAESTPLVWKSAHKELEENSELGRNCTLFDQLRMWAYRNVQRYKTTSNYEAWLKSCQLMSDQFNTQFDAPLSTKEANQVAKSVANYCFYKYTGDGKNRGIMNLTAKGHSLTDEDKKKLGAQYTAGVKRTSTEQAIREAVAYLNTAGKKVNCSSVAMVTGLNKSGVTRNYKDLIKSLNKP